MFAVEGKPSGHNRNSKQRLCSGVKRAPLPPRRLNVQTKVGTLASLGKQREEEYETAGAQDRTGPLEELLHQAEAFGPASRATFTLHASRRKFCLNLFVRTIKSKRNCVT